MNNLPLVSIIMPAYNAQQYIKESIESVINQTYTNWELIIINDGSTDSTADTIKSFEDKRIILIEQENRGVSAARNRGLEIAKGEYITFLDADDMFPKYAIEERVYYFEYHPSVDVVHGKISIRDEKLEYEIKSYQPFAFKSVLKNTLHLDNKMFFNPGYMIRKNRLNSIKFQEGMTHAEDILFLLRLSSTNITFGFIPKTMYYYRVTKTSAMSDMKGWRKGYLDLLNNIRDIPTISYTDTLIMRLKIVKMLASWHIKNKNIVGLVDILKVLLK